MKHRSQYFYLLWVFSFILLSISSSCGKKISKNNSDNNKKIFSEIGPTKYCKGEGAVSKICLDITGFIPGQEYELHLATDIFFTDIVLSQTVNQSELIIKSDFNGVYFYRVISLRDKSVVNQPKKIELVSFFEDFDNDGLVNGIEMNGIDGADLPDFGTNYKRKTLLVYMDYMGKNLLPSNSSLIKIKEVFKNSPVENPDGSLGIDLILETGSQIPFDSNLMPVESEFYALKNSYFPENRRGIYHYMMWAHGYDGNSSSGLSFGIPARDFLVTLGIWGISNTEEAKIGTFIHELGHNLGLRHGGDSDLRYNPNYLSVMNYSYQIAGVLKDGLRVFDFQRIDTLDLDENNLDESKGIGLEAIKEKYGVIYYCKLNSNNLLKVTLTDLSNGIDWNCDNQITDGVSHNINYVESSLTPIKSQNNWKFIDLAGGISSSGGGASRDPLEYPKELSLERYLEIQNIPQK